MYIFRHLQACYSSWDIVVDTATKLRSWMVRSSIARKSKNFLLSKTVHTGSWVHPPSYLVDMGLLSLRKSSRDVELTTYLHLVPKSRISGAKHLSPCMLSNPGQRQLYSCRFSKKTLGEIKVTFTSMYSEIQYSTTYICFQLTGFG